MASSILFDPDLAPSLHAAGIRTAEHLLALGDPEEPRRFVGLVDLAHAEGSQRFHLKRYRYAGWGASRGLLGRGTLWGTPPEIREFENLRTLRGHGIPAVQPAAACAVWRHGRLAAHALLTVAVDGALDLQARLQDPADPVLAGAAERRSLMRRLGSVLGRMHALPFIHRDLRARNILVRASGANPEFWLLDCRRGGARARGGPIGDLAALDRDLRGALTRGERCTALHAYLAGEGDPKALVARIAAIRATLPPPRRIFD